MRLPKVLDSLQGCVGFWSSQARWAINNRWRRAPGHHGAFAQGEASARAAQLTERWERTWPGADPLGYVLRVEYADRWVRFHSFWAASGLSDPELDALLFAAADDRGHFVIGAPDLEWLYCPYDGGADVLLPSAVERDALRERHADWLSSHPGGL